MAKKDPRKNEEPARRLRKVVKDGVVSMLTTVGPDGSLHSRPIRTSRIEPDGSIYLIELAGAEVASDGAQVSLSYARRKNDRYVSVSGVAGPVRDPSVIDELWNSRFKSWFPDGTGVSETSMVRVTVNKVDYWELDEGRTVAYAQRSDAVAVQEPARPAPTAGAQG